MMKTSAPVRILTGDALAMLKRLEHDSFDGCFCDPPYGLSSTEKRNMRRQSPRASSRATATGFMGMAWDAQVPGVELWAEVLRVLKPGAPILVFGGARTFHRLVCAIEDAGFLVADTICWVHGQGFPKGKAQLKPAWEPITLAWKKGKRAPLAIEASRIDLKGGYKCRANGRPSQTGLGDNYNPLAANKPDDKGRWPANVILDPESAALLDEQSGHLVSGGNPSKRSADKHRTVYAGWKGEQCLVHRGTDAGGAARFFYCAKASKKERGEGNTHPTVKPLKLCEYLARLILPPGKNAKLLVPFSGSGSEIIGARRAGWKHITGIEAEAEYVAMTRARLKQTVHAATARILTMTA